MATLNARLLALESLVSKDEIVGFEICDYASWPDPVPPDWVEIYPGSGIWSTPAQEVPHEHA